MKFADRCYEVLKRVPRGKVVSYKQIASFLCINGYRAVGGAMNKNNREDVACHRVVCSDGSLGGFNGGVMEKERLLRAEGIGIVGGKIDMKKFRFEF